MTEGPDPAAATVSCTSCGTALPAGARFCTQCGASFAAGELHPTPAPAPTPDPPPMPSPGQDPTMVTEPIVSDPTMVVPGPPAAPPISPPDAAPGSTPAGWSGPATAAPAAWPGTAPAPQAPQWSPTPDPGPAAGWGAPSAPVMAPAGTWPGTAPPPAAPSKGGNMVGGLLTVAGSILLAVGAFTPWVRTRLEVLSGWTASTDAKILVAMAVVTLVLGVVSLTGVRSIVVRLLVAAAGAAAMGIAAVNVASVYADVPEDLNPAIGVGLVLVAAAGLVLIVAGLATRSKQG